MYGMQKRVGEASKPTLTIDGFTDPSLSDWFCAGLLFNTHCDPVVERTQDHIGHSVCLHYVGGEVWAECLSRLLVQILLHTNSGCYIYCAAHNMLKIHDDKIIYVTIDHTRIILSMYKL